MWRKKKKKRLKTKKRFQMSSKKQKTMNNIPLYIIIRITWKADRSRRAKMLRKRMPCKATWMTPAL